MIILDTDCLSLLERTSRSEFKHLSERLAEFSVESITTTIVTFDEQMRGWMAVVARSKTVGEMIFAYERLEGFLTTFRVIPILSFDDDAGRVFDELKKQKLRVGTMDLRIASIAISRNAILVSRNLVDFERIPGLTVEDWTKEAYIH
jgi:tRNA(fMet)-specific endonuclease VapC